MGDHRLIDRARAERLLRGTDSGTDAVGRLLAAARAPSQAGEVHREVAAVGAFRVGAAQAPRRRVPDPGRRLWPRVVGVKAAAVALAVAATGVAVAAGTGMLPNPLVDSPPAPTTAGPPATPDSPWSSPAEQRSPSTGPGSGTPTAVPSATAADHASLVGLCRAYQGRGDRDPGSALGSAAFAALVAAAGGADGVGAFCTDLLAAEEPPAHSDGPGNGGQANGSAHGSDPAQNDVATHAPTQRGGAAVDATELADLS